ncbi:MAG TPA: VWA domain-containing protein [Candidatus Latescibacteria bacterium]|mgnify:FL=1|nr:VWA domain-containing protein [Candidatus Latescibacterota bacterium]
MVEYGTVDILISLVTQLWRDPEWLWGLLLVPIVPLAYFVLEWRVRSLITRLGNLDVLTRSAIEVSTRLRMVRLCLFSGAIAFGFAAAARPQWGSSTEIVHSTGLDIVLLLDTSLSMLAEDLKPNRLESAKLEVATFLDKLKSDRMALVPFAGTAFIQCPLTLDYSALRLFLSDITPYTVSEEGTQIGTAIRTGLKAFGEGDDRSRVMVLITDGEDQGSNPLEAAQMAADEGVRIYAIGIGSPEGELIPDTGIDGRPDFLRDDQGSVVKTKLDEEALREIAIETGGEYYRASPGGRELEAILESISDMERTRQGEFQTVARIDRYQTPLACSVLLFLVIPFVPERAGTRRRS